MATLHIINQPLAYSSFEVALAGAGKEDAILFIGDAVYSLFGAASMATKAKTFVLTPDLLARGLSHKAIKGAHTAVAVDYAEFVALTEIYHPVVSWY